MNPISARSALLAISLAAVAVLPGCVGAAIGAGATVGTAAMEERGLDGAADDTLIRARINELWSEADERLWRKVGLQVYGGRALLTGLVDTPEMRTEAVRLAWKAEGVREVINEIQIAEGTGVTGYTNDTIISTRLKTELLFDGKIASINYSIETVNGVVYLIGVAQSQEELDRVTDYARNLDYVKKVVSYVRIKKPDPPKSS